MGIFGTRLVAPRAAARQVQIVLAEAALETDPAAVRGALQAGYVMVPREQAMSSMQHLRDLAQRVNPMVVVAANQNSDASSE